VQQFVLTKTDCSVKAEERYQQLVDSTVQEGPVSDEPATVFGNSSGALVALQLLIDHPAVVATVIAHEPPAVRLLPDGDEWITFFDTVYDTYRTSGIHPALRQFSEGISGGRGRPAVAHGKDPGTEGRPVANLLYWFERELRQYPRAELDVAALASRADRLVLAGGRGSKRYLTYQPAAVLAATLGMHSGSSRSPPHSRTNYSPRSGSSELLAALR
jgi:acetyltransferase/esterase